MLNFIYMYCFVGLVLFIAWLFNADSNKVGLGFWLWVWAGIIGAVLAFVITLIDVLGTWS